MPKNANAFGWQPECALSLRSTVLGALEFRIGNSEPRTGQTSAKSTLHLGVIAHPSCAARYRNFSPSQDSSCCADTFHRLAPHSEHISGIMGSSFSNQNPDEHESTGATKPGSGAMKQDFYTLLGVERTADQDEIKKAYRRKALELHPDKNVNNAEAATQLFSEVQAAYEVLSDPQERAWYDSHREQILRDDDDTDESVAAARALNVTITTAELLKKFSLFSTRMDMQDSNPNGFYATAAKLFETIAREEEAAASLAGVDCQNYPAFGNSKSDYQDYVRPFYAVWTGFSTAKSFAWEDKYRYRDAPDRRVKRLMEKENKKLREQAIREFNDTVETDEERNAAAREASKDQSRRARAENAAKLANYTEAEWSKTKDVYQDDETDDDEDEEEEPVLEYECVACNKTFKTEKQMEMHEKSKKHIKTVQSIKRQMRKDGISLDLDEEPSPTLPKLQEESSGEDQDVAVELNDSGAASPAKNTEDESDDEPEESLAKSVQQVQIGEQAQGNPQNDTESNNDASENDAPSSQAKPTKKARRRAKQTKQQPEIVIKSKKFDMPSTSQATLHSLEESLAKLGYVSVAGGEDNRGGRIVDE
ncbi:hypothetical protein Dda_9381 [Drechslerella dactyloides]|uniref:Uncharacterized protein n=1 Tax=Drechslerella dactyloides TaxID=74499 RepID=A0AAD6NF98_DREDA|nr:hypothetical protein Dda_9381 [Drechslerella dactyloides]